MSDTMTNTEHCTPVMQGRHLYKDSMTCVTNDFLSVYRCPVFHTVICTDTSVNIREKQNAFGV